MLMSGCFLIFVFLRAPIQAQEASTNTASKIQELRSSAEWGLEPAILELGRIGDKSQIPFSKYLLQHPRKLVGHRKRELREALAKLGDREAFQELAKELKNPNPGIQHGAI